MKSEILNVYERPETEVLILVHESNFLLESQLETPHEQGGEVELP